MTKNKNYRNGNGVLELTRDAKGPEAERIRGVISWNEAKERAAKKKGDQAAADRHAANRASLNLQLIRIAQAG